MFFKRKIRKGKGVGSIIGATFILLIILTGFSLYNLYFEETKRYTQILQDMQQLDSQRNSEEVEFVSVSTTSQDKLNITAKNVGSYQTHLIWLGVFNEANNSQRYYEIDYYIDPSETVTDIRNESITIPEGESREIQLVTEFGNTFYYDYPADALESGQSTVTIIGTTEDVYNPSQWNLLGSTTYVSGSTVDLESNEGNYTIFLSYFNGSGISMEDYVDNDTSNVDGSSDKGNHSNFSSEQAGPDSIIDILTEEDTALGMINSTLINQESFEGTWPPTGWSESPGNSRWNKEADEAYHLTYSADFDGFGGGRDGDLTTIDLDCSDADAIYIDFWYRDESLENGEFLLQYWDGSLWDTIIDLGSTASEYQWLHYQEKVTDNQYFISDFKIRWSAVDIDDLEHAYVDYVNVNKESDNINHELDLEVQWTNVDYEETNEELAIYLDSGSAEAIRVDAWYGSSWENLITNLTVGWNNVSVASYLDSSIFTIRFKGGIEAGDTNQDSWNIDATLLHVWSTENKYVSEVEFLGPSNQKDWTKTDWQIDSNWDIGEVAVTIQFYNYVLNDYVSNGDGFYAYDSDLNPNTDELVSQTITSNPSRFRNSSGNWKVKLKGVKSAMSQFLCRVDWIEFKTYTFASSNDPIPFDTWKLYRIKAETAEGDPIPYATLSLSANSTYVSFINALTNASLTNPGWDFLDGNGEYYLELKSANPSEDTFILKAVVGSIVGEKSITQTAP